MRRVVQFIVFAILPGFQIALGQVPYFQSYSLLRKNDPVQVNAMFSDQTGNMWYGTDKGLFRFDGTVFRRYTKADSLPDERITALGEDSLGRIWVGTYSGQLAMLDKSRFRRFEPEDASPKAPVSDILFDRRGNLWISTFNEGLWYLQKGDARLKWLTLDEGLPDMFVYDIMEDDQGNIWTGTDGGATRISLVDNRVQIKVFNYQNGLPDNIVKKLLPGEGGTIWMGTEDAGVFNFDPSTQKYQSVSADKWKYGGVNDFLFHGSQIWISAKQTGLVVYDRNVGQFKVYNENAGAGFRSVTSLLKDAEGNIWASGGSTVMRTLGDQLEYITNLEPAKDMNVVAVAVDHEGSIWFANSEGLYKRSQNGTGASVTSKQLVNTPYEKFAVISLYVDRDGQIWAGLYGEGALRINPVKQTIRYLNKELRNGNVLSIVGKDNVVWLATLGGGSRIHFRGDQLEIKNFGSTDGLVTDYVYQVFIDSHDRVWFATDGKGVDMLDQAGFHHFEKGLTSKVIYGFAEDVNHTLWINTKGDGLYAMEGDTFVLFQKEKGIRDESINVLTSDLFGNILVMNDLGIDIYNVGLKTMQYLGDELGIQGRKANLNVVAHDLKGNLYLGTDNGIIRYEPSGNHVVSRPVPYISGLSVFGKTIDTSGKITLDYDQNDVTINYVGMWYQNPSAVGFQFMLENYDRDWIDSRNRAATYSRLPAGNYTFRLRVSDNDDFSISKEVSVQFTISPPFWKTAWFLILSILTLGFSVVAYIRYRERKLQRNNHLLEEKVKERTMEIQRKNDEIQAINEEIQAQSEEIMGFNENLEMLVRERTRQLEMKNKALEEYAFINAHQLRAPVASILGLINLMRAIELKDQERVFLEHLELSATKLDAVVSSITKAIEKGDNKIEKND